MRIKVSESKPQVLGEYYINKSVRPNIQNILQTVLKGIIDNVLQPYCLLDFRNSRLAGLYGLSYYVISYYCVSV